ncbi:RHS repeat protein, partial [Streptomyces cyaneofuscatus]
NTYAYSPRGVQRATTTEQGPQPYRFAGGYQDLSLDGIGNALGISGIVYAGLTEGQDAAEAATAAMIAEIGITGLCIAGEAAFTAVGAAAATPYCVVIGAAAATYVGATYQNDLS